MAARLMSVSVRNADPVLFVRIVPNGGEGRSAHAVPSALVRRWRLFWEREHSGEFPAGPDERTRASYRTLRTEEVRYPLRSDRCSVV